VTCTSVPLRHLDWQFHENFKPKQSLADQAAKNDGPWMKHVAGSLNDGLDGLLDGCRYLIYDRASLCSADFRMIPEAAGVQLLRLPARSRNLNAFAERFVPTIELQPRCPSCCRKRAWNRSVLSVTVETRGCAGIKVATIMRIQD
jgi:hypothetical protein